MSKKGRALVAMSGGIDSTVSAILLHEEGYEVVGVTLKTWDYSSFGGTTKETGCCSLDSINDARDIAVKMGFHHFVLDIRNEFGQSVIDNFIDEYLDARTPNPCILCNTHIKWSALLKRAQMLDCEFLATGHYAKRKYENGRYFISKGEDQEKDQSYVLWGLEQENLKRTLFPVGEFTKAKTRELAQEFGFANMSKKKESYDICFIPDNDYHSFIKRNTPDFEKNIGEGNVYDIDGNILGKHKGYPFYTIGQRKGVGVATGKPVYVIDIQKKENALIVGEKEALKKSMLKVRNINMLKYNTIREKMQVTTKIRYKHNGNSSFLSKSGDLIEVHFEDGVYGATPGQSAVFYEDDDVIGGGFIV